MADDPAPEYRPCAVYYPESDALEYVERDVATVYEPINLDLDLLRDMETREVIGIRLNRFSRWKDKL